VGYLITTDYLMQIQPQLRAQINALAIARAELTAKEEINGYVSKKYDTSAEFTETLPYAPASAYNAGQRAVIDFSAWVASTSYIVNALVIYQAKGYICTTANNDATFQAGNWTLLGNQYQIYYGSYPKPVFDVYANYFVGDQVWYKNKLYTCKVSTLHISDFQALQYIDTNNVPLPNVFPDAPTFGVRYWTDNGAYSIAAGVLPTDTTKWTNGDNRSQLMVTHMINIALYWAHYSIAPNNVPENRVEGYGIAKEWCKSVRDGVNSTPLPAIQPKRGQRILADSQVKRGNSY
jgi:hypothetical protein